MKLTVQLLITGFVMVFGFFAVADNTLIGKWELLAMGCSSGTPFNLGIDTSQMTMGTGLSFTPDGVQRSVEIKDKLGQRDIEIMSKIDYGLLDFYQKQPDSPKNQQSIALIKKRIESYEINSSSDCTLQSDGQYSMSGSSLHISFSRKSATCKDNNDGVPPGISDNLIGDFHFTVEIKGDILKLSGDPSGGCPMTDQTLEIYKKIQ